MSYLNIICRIIIKDKIEVPENIIHFHVKDENGIDYTDIPFDFHSIDSIRTDLKNYENINQINIDDYDLSTETKELLKTVRSLDLKSFLIESFIDYGDSYPIDELINVIVENGNILKETLETDGYLHRENYNYDSITYRNYQLAERKYFETKIKP